MTMEPDPDGRRLTAVNAQNPGTTRAHETHDRLLVARFALGDDLASDEASVVRALLASCADCASLVSEMQVVQHSTATSFAPSRPRDFFITAEQAATLRPSAWQRFLGRLAAPDLTVLRPLAGATLAIGIVLVGVGAVLPKPAPDPVVQPRAIVVEASPASGGGLAGSQQSGLAPSPAGDSRELLPMRTKASPGIEGTSDLNPEASFGSQVMMIAHSPLPDATITAYGAQLASPLPVTDDTDVMATSGAVAPAEDPLGAALLFLGVVLAVVSGLVLLLAWLARRVADPLLR